MMKIIIPLMSIPLLKKNQWPLTIAILFLLVTASFQTIPMASTYSPNLSQSLSQMSAALIMLSLWLTPLVLLASYPIFHATKDETWFIMITMTLIISLLMAFSMNSLISFYIMFETTLIPTMLLIMRWGPQPERLLSSMYMLMYTLTASLPLLVMLTMIFMSTSNLSIISPNIYMPISSKISIFLIIAFLVKLPMYSTHQWLPKAHVEAPVAGSMILAGILLKLGAYGLFLMFSMNLDLDIYKYLLTSLSLTGATTTALLCLRQADMKSLIAYASVAHMSFMLTAIMMESPLAWQGATIMLIAHGLTSSGLFAAVNFIYESYKTRSLTIIKAVLSHAPMFGLWWFMLIISNMGTPPFINLPAEMFLISSISSMWMFPYTILLIMLIFLTSSYSLLLYTSTSHGTPHSVINPMSMNSPRNHLTLIMHLLPLLFMMLTLSYFTPQ
uniref:NADH-ubiquinone oxidoreductase chain 4 n=1 Tax=Sabella spallanzanii TaxID=85702 RepID=A0A7T1WKB6_SABSP|nr:NADH dehydrogenase subunit 4 [Sabella spallanzanii]QPO99963.1 NADH dehydrogenase subunit 4 [Sabella spallanzanii]UJM44185.1 NADH dehydrogenase subunit 4 [Sabella spallanzanii]UYP50929.1 NADH dehydrogenase subunit 4 [Sabella spallanzanii]